MGLEAPRGLQEAVLEVAKLGEGYLLNSSRVMVGIIYSYWL